MSSFGFAFTQLFQLFAALIRLQLFAALIRLQLFAALIRLVDKSQLGRRLN